MCIPALAPLFAGAAGAGATAAGATAPAGMTMGGMLQVAGLVASVGGALFQGIQASKTYKAEAAAIADQKRTEAQLTAVEDQRTRLKFRSAMRQQTAELAARGIDISSPTAVLLGQTAAQEMSFASQEVRSRGAARQRELTSTEQIAKSKATSSLLNGTFSAAGNFLTGEPDVWPELLK